MSEDGDLESIRRDLRDMFICPICGMKKSHSWLYGYRCPNPGHWTPEDDHAVHHSGSAVGKAPGE